MAITSRLHRSHQEAGVVIQRHAEIPHLWWSAIGGVEKGDTPEPTYILKLDELICIVDPDFGDPNLKFDEVQVFAEFQRKDEKEIRATLRRMIGKRVKVSGTDAFAASTGHHHAPLLLPLTYIASDTDPTETYGTAMTTVQAFYLALSVGSGEEAARFVIPEKRGKGPLSAQEMGRFYGSLVEPLSVIDVSPIGPSEFRVRYTFATKRNRCDGVAIVRTTRIGDDNLIESIKALNGC
jgi:hypothetical protein